MRQIVLDTETTGLKPQEGDRVVEIGCVEMLARKKTGKHFHVYLNPERDMPEEAFRVHGLSSVFLEDKPRFAEVAQQFLDYVAGAELVIHNAAFDMGFLNAELARAGLSSLDGVVHGVVDTVTVARQLFPGKRANLDALCDRFGIDRSGRTLHGALLDAELLAEVYIALTRGQNALITESAATALVVQTETVLQEIPLDLQIVYASAQEVEEHEKILQQIDKASAGNTLWRDRT